ncbi:sigma-70 family RNA polymerase sigma factor [Salipiger mangrovisoli]|uniref:Sigma-70 family RNA polymerase sigma factor n=1 Tax=Salipiger mangrovisoli TaxID=2865933 RepID=A0ABR9X0N7_9RHOB|nr:sigma-70 family RNA polymerase sigma factor [Salipiger mangrovisoli]MBE9637125.1 sigma-70 family RNA polymerase sigma factor [Salipiger mangrovisoli]
MMSMTYQAAMREPFLDIEQERRAICSWQDSGDRKALELLLRSHARQAWSQAARFTDNPVHLEDLAAEGFLGLIKAADCFDRQQEVRFSTYAAWWVMNGISGALARIKAVIDIPARTYLDAQTGKLSEEERARIRMATHGIIALDGGEDDEDGRPRDILVSGEPGPEELVTLESERAMLTRLLAEALEPMTPEEAEVIRRRRLQPDPEPFGSIARDLGVSQDRLRQVEKRAMLRLRRNLIDKGFSRAVLT